MSKTKTNCVDEIQKNADKQQGVNQRITDSNYEKSLAEAIGIDSGVVAKATRLTLLSPKIIHKLVLGEADLSMQTLRRSFPLVWEKQESELL